MTVCLKSRNFSKCRYFPQALSS